MRKKFGAFIQHLFCCDESRISALKIIRRAGRLPFPVFLFSRKAINERCQERAHFPVGGVDLGPMRIQEFGNHPLLIPNRAVEGCAVIGQLGIDVGAQFQQALDQRQVSRSGSDEERCLAVGIRPIRLRASPHQFFEQRSIVAAHRVEERVRTRHRGIDARFAFQQFVNDIPLVFVDGHYQRRRSIRQPGIDVRTLANELEREIGLFQQQRQM